MATLDLRPEAVDLTLYAGDTATITITAPDSLVAGLDWNAQVRATADATAVAATFAVTPPTVADGPAYLVLDSETTRALAEGGVVMVAKRSITATAATQRFTGVWDVQVSAGGNDPVRTLARGSVTIDSDVTRLP